MFSRPTTLSQRPSPAWVLSAGAFTDPAAASEHTLEFDRGVPVALDGEATEPVALIERLDALSGCRLKAACWEYR